MRGHALGQSSRGLGRSGWARAGWVLLVVLLIVELASVFVLSRRGRVESPTTGTDATGRTAVDEPRVPAYSVEPPSGWQETDDGTTTILTSGDKSIVISLDLVTGAGPDVVSDRILSLLDEQYRRMHVTAERNEGPSYVVEGRALNSRRVRLRFTAVTVALDEATTEGCHQQLIAFSDVGVERSRVNSVIDDLSSTFQLTGDGCGRSNAA